MTVIALEIYKKSEALSALIKPLRIQYEFSLLNNRTHTTIKFKTIEEIETLLGISLSDNIITRDPCDLAGVELSFLLRIFDHVENLNNAAISNRDPNVKQSRPKDPTALRLVVSN